MRQLGFQVLDPSQDQVQAVAPKPVNTRISLWPERWPAIAKQECIDLVEASEPGDQARVKFELPCGSCEKSSACLNARRKELGTLLYDREIQTRPRSSESTFFPRELFQPYLNRALSLQRSLYRDEWAAEGTAVAQAWDLAWSERTGGDWLVCVTALVDLRTGRRQLIGLERWQRVLFTEQCNLIESRSRAYGADIVCLESDAAQQIWRQHIAATTGVPVIAHSAGEKRNLATGVPSLLIELQNGKWEFPYNPAGWNADLVDVMLTEFEAFGWVGDKLEGVGEHDDIVMAFWHLDWTIKKKLLGGAWGDWQREQARAQARAG